MNTELGLKLKEDRLLRNAAFALLKADVANLRADLAGRGFGERIVDRINEGAVDIFEEAVELADNNRGVLAALIGAVLLWFARNPIMALFTDDDGLEDENDRADGRTEPS
ncbi:hypothetical protein [Allopontixanthobacter sediminis]|uniref:Uncharacterized protein n=1 Tax=Allopontixanthobacter sediminis TaxID=1689985 RepID=A0A845B0N1_9SPHN|nr:hypothetical protein [Allopontixanthobacter sediminis]MXP43704.1 hypothetical protein [Allopontixanthobacter sediminis]